MFRLVTARCKGYTRMEDIIIAKEIATVQADKISALLALGAFLHA